MQVGACWGQRNSSLCLIKNHALSSASLAAILDQIAASFSISAAQMCHFTTAAAHDMLGLYKGVVPLSEYNSMVQDLCSGAPFPPAYPKCNEESENTEVANFNHCLYNYA